jgi:photosystem II stability/assembly factor-like uncharacterized protein
MRLSHHRTALMVLIALVFAALDVPGAADAAPARSAGKKAATKRPAAKPKKCKQTTTKRCKTAKKTATATKAEAKVLIQAPAATRPPSAAPVTTGGATTSVTTTTTTTSVTQVDPIAATTVQAGVVAQPAASAPSTTIQTSPPAAASTGAEAADSFAALTSSSWQPLAVPGSGGRISSVAVSPYDSTRVLVGGDMLGVGLSTDSGQHWSATTGFASWEINDFTWDPRNAGVVWVGTMSGPYKSTDGGKTWTSKRTGLPTGDFPYSAPIQKVLIDPRNSDHLIAVGGNQRGFKAAVTGALNYGVVYESVDGGEHWAQISTVGDNINVVDIVASSNLKTLYAASRQLGVRKSTDGGRTWADANAGLPRLAVRGLAIDPSNANVLWAAVDRSATTGAGVYLPGGIYKSTDGGASWSSANTGLPQDSKANATQTTAMYSVHRASDGSLYTADQGFSTQQRFVSRDGGQTWTTLGAKVTGPFPAASTPYVWASSADARSIYGGTSDAIIASRDRGTTWSDLGGVQNSDGSWQGTGSFSGLLGTRVAFDAARPGTMFVSGFDAGNVMRSTSSGTSWTRPVASWDNYNGGYDVTTGGLTGQVVYAVLGQNGAFNGIGTSQDAGATWSVKAGNGLPARYAAGSIRGSVAIASANGATAYAVLPDGGIYTTADTGATWSRVGTTSDAWSVAASRDFSTVYAATDRGILASVAGGPFTLLANSPTGLRRLVVGAAGVVYGTGPVAGSAAQGGLWVYSAGVARRLSGSRFVSDVAIDPLNASRIVFVTNDNPYHDTSSATGVWVSTDAGLTFTQRNGGLPMTRAYSVAFDPATPGRIVVGTNGRGFWQTLLP